MTPAKIEARTGQLDLFAAQGVPSFGESFEQKSDGRALEPWELERDRIAACLEKARAAGSVRTIQYRHGKRDQVTWQLAEWQGETFAKTDYDIATGGGGGPWHACEADTLDGVQIERFRSFLKKCVIHTDGGWRSDGQASREYARIAAFIFEQTPPLLFGVDLEQEHKETCRVAREEEDRRRAHLWAKHEIEKAMCAALNDMNAWAYPDMIQDRRPGYSDAHFRESFRADYRVLGHGTDLECVIFPRDGADESDELLQLARDRMQKETSATVRFATAEEAATPPYELKGTW